MLSSSYLQSVLLPCSMYTVFEVLFIVCACCINMELPVCSCSLLPACYNSFLRSSKGAVCLWPPSGLVPSKWSASAALWFWNTLEAPTLQLPLISQGHGWVTLRRMLFASCGMALLGHTNCLGIPCLPCAASASVLTPMHTHIHTLVCFCLVSKSTWAVLPFTLFQPLFFLS